MTDISTDQPRGENGHKAGQYSERKPTAPLPSSELTLTGDIGVRPAEILPGDTIWEQEARGDWEEVGQAVSIGFNGNDPDLFRIRLADGRSVTARSSDILCVRRDAVAPGYDSDADYHDRLAVAHHALTGSETLNQIVNNESDDEFMIAVVTHANATHDIINKATLTHSYPVLSAAIANKATSSYTLDRIRRQAVDRQYAFASLLSVQGHSTRVLWDMRQNEHLNDDAAYELSLR
jgi:hypothetical protein